MKTVFQVCQRCQKQKEMSGNTSYIQRTFDRECSARNDQLDASILIQLQVQSVSGQGKKDAVPLAFLKKYRPHTKLSRACGKKLYIPCNKCELMVRSGVSTGASSRKG